MKGVDGIRIEKIKRHEVFEDDRWRCRICRRKVRDDVERAHPRKATMAHIVALKAGGEHTRENICTLCHECNCRDWVNKLPIQTALLVGDSAA
jgi:hypothetical protein